MLHLKEQQLLSSPRPVIYKGQYPMARSSKFFKKSWNSAFCESSPLISVDNQFKKNRTYKEQTNLSGVHGLSLGHRLQRLSPEFLTCVSYYISANLLLPGFEHSYDKCITPQSQSIFWTALPYSESEFVIIVSRVTPQHHRNLL